jgi:hypothetical protein
MEHRDATRLRTTVEGLRKTVSDDGRIHTTFNQTIAATGRLSSNDPNLQNIPIRTESVAASGPLSWWPRRMTCSHRRLQPDRDAHHGAPVGGPGTDRGVPLG